MLAAEVSACRLELTVERFARRQGVVYLLDMQRGAAPSLDAAANVSSSANAFASCCAASSRNGIWPKSAPMPISNTVSRPRFRAHFSNTADTAGQPSPARWKETQARYRPSASSGYRICARERRIAIEGLAIDTPAGQERTTASLLRRLDPASARFALFTYSPRDEITGVDPQACGNLDRRLEPCRRAEPNRENPLAPHSRAARRRIHRAP